MTTAVIASEHGWTLQNDVISLRLGTNGAIAISLRNDPTTWLFGSAAAVTGPLSGGVSLSRPLELAGKGISHEMSYADEHGSGARLDAEFTVSSSGLRLRCAIMLYEALPCIRLQIGIQNPTAEPLLIEQLLPLLVDAIAADQAGAFPDEALRHAPLCIGGKDAGWACYQQGWQSWSYTGALPPMRAGTQPRNRTLRAMHHPLYANESLLFRSWGQIAVSEALALVGFPQTLPALLVGFLRSIDQAGQILIDSRGGRLAATAHAEGKQLKPGEEYWSEPVVIGFGAEEELLKHYAAMAGREMRARADRAMPTGWCSWYYYFTRVTEHDIMENLQALSARKDELPLQIVQIDDGYQKAVGDWTSINDKFPGGMQRLASAIKEQGFQPGIWLAPFTATADSQLASEHPEWLLRDRQGRPVFVGKNWGSTMYGLDCTHPQVQDWLRRLFSTIVENWGYTYLKLDFLYCAALPGLHYHPERTSVQALRDGLQTVRATVGDDIPLLGCGCPMLPAVGLVDAMRISPDVAPQWPARFHGIPVPNSERAAIPAAVNAIRNSLTRAWMHRAFWINDPDCLLVRDHESKLTDDEIRTLASVIGLTGGMLLLSDPMHTLRDERWSLATLLMPPLDQAAQPRSWLDEPWPSLISTQFRRPWGTFTLAGLFNWANQQREIRLSLDSFSNLPAGAYHICEFWRQRYLGSISNELAFTLPAHGSAVLAIQPVTERPTILSTDLHLGQGAAEVKRFTYDEARKRIEWEIDLRRNVAGSIRLFIPTSLRPGTLTASASEVSLRSGSQPGEYIIQATIARQATFALDLEASEP